MTGHTLTELGKFGFTIDVGRPAGHPDDAAAIESLGFTGLWINGGQLDHLSRLADLVHATDSAVIGSAIIPPDVHGAEAVKTLYRQVESTSPGRLLVGLGSPQRPHALTAVKHYADELDAAPDPIPRQRRVLAALGPVALDIARDRFGGAVAGLVTPDYVTVARQRLGRDPILAVGLFVVLDGDPDSARTAARVPLSFMSGLAPYAKSLSRQGFTDDDVRNLDDGLVDALVAWGSPDDVAARVHRMLAAGANHVIVSALGGSGQPTGAAAARLLAPALG